jgi:hypothetical protein
MKKQTTTLLIIGAAAAAWFIFTSMRKRRGSSVEAGPTIKQTAEEFEAETPQQPPAIVKTAQSVLDIFKTFKRSPEKKAAAVSKKQLKKATKLGVKQAKKLSAGFGGCNGLY